MTDQEEEEAATVTSATIAIDLDILHETAGCALAPAASVQPVVVAVQAMAADAQCRSMGNYARDCLEESKQCYNCNELGHITKDCIAHQEPAGANNMTSSLPFVTEHEKTLEVQLALATDGEKLLQEQQVEVRESESKLAVELKVALETEPVLETELGQPRKAESELKETQTKSANRENLLAQLGELQLSELYDYQSDNFQPSGKLLNVLPKKDERVIGVATFGDELFVVRQYCRHVDVYDVTTFKLKRILYLLPNEVTFNPFRGYTYTDSDDKDTHCNWSLAACGTNKCVYVSDFNGNYIGKVDMFCKTPFTHWEVSSPRGVSLNNDHNVLVACYGVKEIREYSPTGDLIRTINLPSNIDPMHVIQLPSGQYGVTHEGSTHGYSVVDVDGKVVNSHGSSHGSGIGQFNKPRGFAVNKRGFIFIADCCNNRIVVLDPESFTSTVLSIDGGVKEPWCIHLDEPHQRMYIGEDGAGGGGRVIELGPELSN